MTEQERRIDRATAELLWGGFYRCPTTGRIIEALQGDDKAICGCRRSNPRMPAEQTERTGVHIIRFLDQVTTDEYLDQREADRQKETR